MPSWSLQAFALRHFVLHDLVRADRLRNVMWLGL